MLPKGTFIQYTGAIRFQVTMIDKCRGFTKRIYSRSANKTEVKTRSNGEQFQICENPQAPSPGENSNTCGVKGPVTKIVGGATAEQHKYTWLAMLGIITCRDRPINNENCDISDFYNHQSYK